MKLERVAVELRPRSEWEAADLGVLMVRRWWRPVAAAWALVYVPVAVGSTLAFGGWGLLATWWLLPLLDRAVLAVLARAVFGDVPEVADVARELPRLASRAFLSATTLERLTPRRAAELPARQLEGLSGRALRERLSVLRGGTGAASEWLSTSCFLSALGLTLAAWALVRLMVPPTAGVDWELVLTGLFTDEAVPWARAVLLGGPLLAMGVLEPFHVGAGFALYLNRRTILEGWDVEIAFRRIAERLERDRPREPRRVASGAVAALLVLGMATPSPAGDPDRWAAVGAPADPAAVATEVLREPEFGESVTVTEWELRWELPWDAAPGPSSGSVLGAVAAGVGRVLLVAALVTAIAIASWAVLRRRRPGARRASRAEAAPQVVCGLDVTPESLPADPAGEAQRLWRAGDRVAALGVLYRSALACLVHRDGVALREGDTEEDCLRAATPLLPQPTCRYLESLTRAWQRAAYGHRAPDDAARELVGRWRDHFEPAT